MAFWPVRADIVTDNLATFSARTGIAVTPVPIEGDYAAAIEAAFASGEGPDVFYAQRGEASRWLTDGLIRPLDGLDGADAILAEHRPLIAASARADDRRIIGLTYYNAGPFALFRNEALLAAAGFGTASDEATHPRRWEEVEAMARSIRARGLSDHPILMRWYRAPTGLPWAFLADCAAEGERLVDAAWEPLLGPDTPAAMVLARWRRLVREGLAPLAALDHDDVSIDDAWCAGGHAFYPTMDYLTAAYSARAPGRFSINATYPGATGDTLLLGHAILCLSATPMPAARLSDAWRLLRFLGHRDDDGTLFVHRRWACEMNLWTPYEEIDRDEAVRAARRSFLPPGLAASALAWQDAQRTRAAAPPLVRAPGYMAWSAALARRIEHEVLKGDAPVAQVVACLREDWLRLAGSSR
ncbi:ABC transporter substrate-binding protein [Elioraea sp.]|uniref:ABC transporter substrate-binding protein n=1 Tax=Elioraea sp. TaxID=2185103 RepID=UPI0025BBA6C9|nr:extracellular solute-binding protein [Elioraea sp.]